MQSTRDRRFARHWSGDEVVSRLRGWSWAENVVPGAPPIKRSAAPISSPPWRRSRNASVEKIPPSTTHSRKNTTGDYTVTITITITATGAFAGTGVNDYIAAATCFDFQSGDRIAKVHFQSVTPDILTRALVWRLQPTSLCRGSAVAWIRERLAQPSSIKHYDPRNHSARRPDSTSSRSPSHAGPQPKLGLRPQRCPRSHPAPDGAALT